MAFNTCELILNVANEVCEEARFESPADSLSWADQNINPRAIGADKMQGELKQ